MASPKDLVLKRLDFTRDELLKILVDHVENEFLDWAPAPGMRTVGGQFFEIVGSELQLLRKLQGKAVPGDEELRRKIGDIHETTGLLVVLGEVREETERYIYELSDEEWEAPVSLGSWHEGLGLPEIPRGEAFVGLAQHEAYHTGQLVSYLWARGDNPYDW